MRNPCVMETIMARKPLPPGTHGDVRLYAHIDGKWIPKADVAKGSRPPRWRAITNYRGHDGETRQVERSGTSATDAGNRLRSDLAALSGTRASLTSASRVEDAVPAYLDRIRDECAPTTCDRYVSALHTHVLPGIGRLLFTECTVEALHRFDGALVSFRGVPASKRKTVKRSELPKLSPGSRRAVREVVRALMQLAVETNILDHNPVLSTRKIRGGGGGGAKAMPAEQVQTFFEKLDNDRWSRFSDLPDVVRTLFGLGCRIGEAMGLTWKYVNLTDKPISREAWGKVNVIPPHSAWLAAQITTPRGQGLVYSELKTKRSNRIVGIPTFLDLALLLRRPADAADDEPVFPSLGPGTWRSPKVVGEQIARMRGRLGVEFRSHGGRKTAATVLYDDRQLDDRDLADQFGHASGAFTRSNYVDSALANPAAATALDRIYSQRSE